MDDCLFCKIIAKKIPAKFEFENEALAVIQDIDPKAPTHLLVIPKRHIACVSDVTETDINLLGNLVYCAGELARKKGLEDGFRLIFNNGPQAGQTVFHVHLHLLGGRPMSWPPG
jgi:histidine triad (HIT) family protein